MRAGTTRAYAIMGKMRLASGPDIPTGPLPIDLLVRPWPAVLATLKNRTLSPVVERFIECAREVAKSIAGRSL